MIFYNLPLVGRAFKVRLYYMNKQQLLEKYAFKKMLYSLSLKERIMSKLGWLRVDSQVPEGIEGMYEPH